MANLTYTPPEVTSILGVVDTFLRWKQSQDHRNYSYYHPSEWGHCLRKAQYNRYVELGLIDFQRKEIDSQKLRLFDKGHNMHNRWQHYFADIGVLKGFWKCANPLCDNTVGKEEQLGVFKPLECIKCGSNHFKYREVRVFDQESNFRGNCDLILDFSKLKSQEDLFDGVRKAFNIDHLPSDPIVIDMKTINQDAFKKVSRGPHPEYVIQLTIYIHLLDCQYGLIIYENKNKSDLVAYKVERNDDKFKIIQEQARTMNSLVEKKYLPPPRPKTKSDYECKFCDFTPLCHKSKVWNDPNLDEKRKKFYKVLL